MKIQRNHQAMNHSENYSVHNLASAALPTYQFNRASTTNTVANKTANDDATDVFHLWHGKDVLVPTFSNQNLPVPILNDAERRRAIARDIADVDIDVRYMSARQMANLSTDLYIQGLISWEEYDALAFQSELHPDYNKTVGALLNKTAQPDAPRDFVREWEKRLTFVRRYNNHDVHSINIAQGITRLLRQMAGVLAYE